VGGSTPLRPSAALASCPLPTFLCGGCMAQAQRHDLKNSNVASRSRGLGKPGSPSLGLRAGGGWVVCCWVPVVPYILVPALHALSGVGLGGPLPRGWVPLCWLPLWGWVAGGCAPTRPASPKAPLPCPPGGRTKRHAPLQRHQSRVFCCWSPWGVPSVFPSLPPFSLLATGVGRAGQGHQGYPGGLVKTLWGTRTPKRRRFEALGTLALATFPPLPHTT
jgi:hypothetical protein